MSTDPKTRHDEARRRTAAPIGGEQQEDLPAAKYREPDRPADDRAEAMAEQRREMAAAGSVVGPTAGIMTDAQGRGALVGGVLGGLVGLVVFVALAFIPLGIAGLTMRLVIFGAVGLMAGAAAGAVYGGGRAPELEGEASDAEVRAPVTR